MDGIGSGYQGSSIGWVEGLVVVPCVTFLSRATTADPSATAWWIFATKATLSFRDLRLPRAPRVVGPAEGGCLRTRRQRLRVRDRLPIRPTYAGE